MAQLASALACHASSPSRRLLPLDWIAKSMIVVVPPKAAARVPVSKVSTECVPPKGISKGVWPSMAPGMTYWPLASIKRSAPTFQSSVVVEPGAAKPTMVSPSTKPSAANGPLALIAVPPLIKVFMEGPFFLSSVERWLRRDQALVAVRASVAVEGPGVTYLFQHAHVEVAHDHFVLRVRRGVTDELASRIDKVRRSVETVVAQIFDTNAVDGAHEVLVRDRGRGLFEVPEVGGQPSTRRRGVEHDLRAGQSERAPTLGEVAVVTDVDADRSDGGVK